MNTIWYDLTFNASETKTKPRQVTQKDNGIDSHIHMYVIISNNYKHI